MPSCALAVATSTVTRSRFVAGGLTGDVATPKRVTSPSWSNHPVFTGHDALPRGLRRLGFEGFGFFGRRRFQVVVRDRGLQLLQSGGAEVDLQVVVRAHEHPSYTPLGAELVTDDRLFFEWHMRSPLWSAFARGILCEQFFAAIFSEKFGCGGGI